jgi:hypothetical protein
VDLFVVHLREVERFDNVRHGSSPIVLNVLFLG